MSEWPEIALRRICASPIVNGVGEAAQEYEEGSLRYIRTTDIADLHHLDETKRVGLPPSLGRAAMIKPGDILMTAAGSLGTSYLADGDEAACFAGYLVRLRADRALAEPRFLAWWTASRHHRDQVRTGAVRSTIDNFSASKFRALRVPLPPLTVQSVIADFLDRETAQIDAMIEAQEILLAAIEERLSALNEASVFPFGLSSAEGQDGAWMGYVPRHWRISSMSSLCSLIQTGPFGSQLKADEYEDEGIAVVNPADISLGVVDFEGAKKVSETTAARLRRHAMQEADVVTARRGDLGRSAVVRDQAVGSLCGTGSLLVRPRTEVLNPDFLVLMLGARKTREALSDLSVGSTMDNLNSQILGRFRVPVPPVEEQNHIVGHLAEISRRTEQVRLAALDTVALMRERRETVITAAVTGMIDPVTGIERVDPATEWEAS
ncbi:hypothetical protein F7P69_02400 [Cellulosimicrobium funkei]|nr:hypothetical protein [Cellulosimicrobium funkei]